MCEKPKEMNKDGNLPKTNSQLARLSICYQTSASEGEERLGGEGVAPKQIQALTQQLASELSIPEVVKVLCAFRGGRVV